MEKKNFMKLFVAAIMICLPFAFTACSSDDDEPTGPRTYTYSWSYIYTLPQNAKTEAKQAALQAEAQISNVFYGELLKQGFRQGAEEQTVTIETEGNVTDWDAKAKAALLLMKVNENAKAAIEVLPANAKIVLKRNNGQIDQQSLR